MGTPWLRTIRVGAVALGLASTGCTYVCPCGPEPEQVCRDLDADGAPYGHCDFEDHPNFGKWPDCNDNPDLRGAEETPGKPEIPHDGLDNDCSFVVDGEHDRIDADGDGYPGISRADWEALGTRHAREWPVSLPSDDAYVDCNDDPDDPSAPQMSPGRPEVPDDGIDQDCDGADWVGAADSGGPG